MELIDKLFWASCLFTCASLVLADLTPDEYDLFKGVVSLIFLASLPVLFVMFFITLLA